MRLIDADALPRIGGRGGIVQWHDILKAPTVDAVPVIRCKDCRYNISVRNWVHCVLLGGMYGRTTDNYCSLAERKDNDSN